MTQMKFEIEGKTFMALQHAPSRRSRQMGQPVTPHLGSPGTIGDCITPHLGDWGNLLPKLARWERPQINLNH